MEEVIIIEDLAKEFFSNNPNSNKMAINKGTLSIKLEIGGTKAETICKGLEAEYPFIRNERGFITIDRKGLEEFEVLREEQLKHISTMTEIIAKFPELSKSIEKYKRDIDERSKVLAVKETENAELESKAKDLENQAKELEEKIAQFGNTMKENQAKIDGLTIEYDRLKEEAELKDREYNELLDKKKKDLEEQLAHLKAETEKKEAEIQPLEAEKVKAIKELANLKENFEERLERAGWFSRMQNRNKINEIRRLIGEVFRDFESNYAILRY